MSNEITTVSQWLRQQRGERGLTQQQLAKQIGVTGANVCQLERSQKRLGFVKMCGLLDALGCTDQQIIELVGIAKQEFKRGKKQ